MLNNKFICLAFVGMVLSACTSVRQMTLFNSSVTTYTQPVPRPFIITPNDRLSIHFSALDPEAVKAFSSAGDRFVVYDDGSIVIPGIGNVKVGGLTEEQAQTLITEKISAHAKNAIVYVSIYNASATILGEVRQPQRIEMSSPISIISAIGIAGDFTPNARRDNIMVQRKEGQNVKI